MTKNMGAFDLSCLVTGQGKILSYTNRGWAHKKALSASAFSRFNELTWCFSFQLTPFPGNSLAAMDLV
jgi:hypothetical protein